MNLKVGHVSNITCNITFQRVLLYSIKVNCLCICMHVCAHACVCLTIFPYFLFNNSKQQFVVCERGEGWAEGSFTLDCSNPGLMYYQFNTVIPSTCYTKNLWEHCEQPNSKHMSRYLVPIV